MYDLNILAEEIPLLRQRYKDADCALVRFHLNYQAGKDSLHQLLAQLDDIFPRWYHRTWTESSELGPAINVPTTGQKSFRDTVLEYINSELVNHDESERSAITALAEQLILEVEQ